MKIKIKAAAKINLFLDILGRLPNGYHSLFMLMQSVSLFDELEIKLCQSKKVEISSNTKSLPTDEENIAFKAALAFFEATGLKNEGIAIHVEKKIPLSAGLAGGSADAAAVLQGLNTLYKEPLTKTQLLKTGLKVGSDVPFCLQGGTMLVQDTGGVMSRLPDLPGCFIVLAKPHGGVSTLEAYKAYDNFPYIRHPKGPLMLHYATSSRDLREIFKHAGNVFEQCIEVPDRVEIKRIMRKYSPICSQMTGSGPTVCAILKNEQASCNCARALKGVAKSNHVCQPTRKSIEINF